MGSSKDPVLVILQMNGANDYMNTVVPYSNPLYHENRPTVGIRDEDLLMIDDTYGFAPWFGPLKKFWDEGKMALVHGVGFANSPRSHFRAMDIWNTCEPETTGTEGWVARSIEHLDPKGENPVKAVNLGLGLPRALVKPGVAVTSVSDLASYGLMSDVEGVDTEQERLRILDRFSRIYSPAIGTGPVMEYLSQTGLNALKGADIIKVAPQQYSSSVEYAATPLAKKFRDMAQVHVAGLGTQIFYTQHGSFDTHMGELPLHKSLWVDVSGAVTDFFADLEEHGAADNVIVMLFTEFGRRVKDNGSGTDHGAGGGAFVIGNRVKGGMYAEFPSLKPADLVFGDLNPTYDFRGFHATLAEQWLGLDPKPIVGGNYEQLDFIQRN